MKEEKLNFKGSYEEAVEYIYKNIDITEPIKFEFTEVIPVNAQMRRIPQFKGMYSYEKTGYVKLNDNNHKENLYRKVCIHLGTQHTDFAAMGID